MERRAWNREQLLRTLALYCQLPFGKMHSRNPAVVAVAAVIGRTPSAVALKLVNFASLDPELRGRGVGGMGNTSAADREVWAEFYGRWDVLAANAVARAECEGAELQMQGSTGRQDEEGRGDVGVLADVGAEQASEHVEAAERHTAPSGPTEVLREAAQRRGQAFFRAAVMAAHDGRCCITGISSAAMLRASHIVPWAADPALRLDPRNGLCLNALHDAAFDRGLITLAGDFSLRVSKRLRAEVPAPIYREMFESRAGAPITMPERFAPTAEMLEYHRRKVFVA